jgi:nucleoside-diphosphate-sugar epimerase
MSITTTGVAVTGASGFLGSAVLAHLGQLGIPVVALSRQERTGTALVRWIRGELNDPAVASELVGPGNLVVHLGATLSGPPAGITSSIIDGTRQLVSIAGKRNARLIHVSSLSVFPPSPPGRQAVIDESTPLDPAPEHRGAYAAAKIRAETIIAEAARRGLDVVVVRPAQLVGDGLGSVPPSLGIAAAGRRWSLAPLGAPLAVVHVDDAATGIVLAGTARTTPAVHLVDPLQPGRRAVLDALRRAGVPRADLPLVDVSRTAGLAAATLTRLGIGAAQAHRLMAVQSSPEYPVAVATGLGWRPAALAGWLAQG